MALPFPDLSERIARSPLGCHLDWQTEHIADDHARLRMPFAPHNVTAGTLVHGGAISALADAAATAACWATPAAGPGSRGTTIALNVNFLKGAMGIDLIADARVVQRGGSICVADVSVQDPDGQVVAVARATYKLTHSR